jgi:hypothetical protein
MLNKDDFVPDNTIAVFTDPEILPKERFNKIVSKPDKKRGWFTPHFYNCLPLVIGNQYGFVFSAEYGFDVIWDGNEGLDAITITPHSDNTDLIPNIQSHFGHGIFTLQLPFVLRTPPGVNLMTINPPNFQVPNVTVMTGVVETDNLRRAFTINLKLQMPNYLVRFEAGAPLCGLLPVPRYFCDKFQLVYADELFDEEIVDAEREAFLASKNQRKMLKDNNEILDRDYFKGRDVFGNYFKDHQQK